MSEPALAIRETFPRARSPAALLFENLPLACGFEPLAIVGGEEDRMDDYLRALVAGLRELRDAYSGMLDDFQRRLGRVFGFEGGSPLALIRRSLAERFHDMERYAGDDRQELKTFIRRLTATHHDDRGWIESIMTWLGKTPPPKWTDDQRAYAMGSLGDLAVRLRDLETLDRAVRSRPTATQEEAILLRTVSSASGEHGGKVAYIRPEQRSLIDAQTERIKSVLAELDDQGLRLAIIARLLQTEA